MPFTFHVAIFIGCRDCTLRRHPTCHLQAGQEAPGEMKAQLLTVVSVVGLSLTVDAGSYSCVDVARSEISGIRFPFSWVPTWHVDSRSSSSVTTSPSYVS